MKSLYRFSTNPFGSLGGRGGGGTRTCENIRRDTGVAWLKRRRWAEQGDGREDGLRGKPRAYEKGARKCDTW